MSTTPVSSPASNPLADLVSRLTRKYDANGDSQLSNAEFGTFLSEFLNNAGSGLTNSTFASGTAATTTRGAGMAVGTMEGFDAGKLANSSHNTVKYQVGRILQQFPNTPQGLADALPQIKLIAPDAKIIGSKGDKLDFGSFTDAHGQRIGIIDVLRGAGSGGQAWQWCPSE